MKYTIYGKITEFLTTSTQNIPQELLFRSEFASSGNGLRALLYNVAIVHSF